MALLRFNFRNGATMRPTEFSSQAIVTLLRKRKIATLPEVMSALGTESRRTAFRKLSELPCHTSYSHRGRYYTLEEIAEFDESGLWSTRDVWFSAHGTLLSTAAAVVAKARAKVKRNARSVTVSRGIFMQIPPLLEQQGRVYCTARC